MQNFIALYRQSDSPQSISAFNWISNFLKNKKGAWRTLQDTDKLLILDSITTHAYNKMHLFANNTGAILGFLFNPKPSPSNLCQSSVAPDVISARECSRIERTNGYWLVENYWGSYIAFIHHESKDTLQVLRSPMGDLPCLHLSYEGVSIFFSTPGVLPSLPGLTYDIDWSVLEQYLKYPYLHNNITPLKGVVSILPGQSIDVCLGKISIRNVWDPFRYASKAISEDPESLSNALNSITAACFASWSSVFSAALLRLSGGFDSSMVAGCFASIAPQKNIIYNTFYYKPNSADDERAYARETARFWSRELIETKLYPDLIDVRIFENLPRIPYPILLSPSWPAQEVMNCTAQKYNLDAILTGDGGDGLFAAYGENFAAKDFIYNGLSAEVFKTAMLSARASETSIWQAFSEMLKVKCKLFLHKREVPVLGDEFSWGLNREVNERIEYNRILPAWYEAELCMPPGKIAQIAGSLPRYDYLDISFTNHATTMIRPILSQPIVEFCLSIPYYILQFDGQSRALARKAYAEYLTPAARLRYYKSHGGFVHYDAVKRYNEFFYKFLAEGILSKRGLLNGSSVEKIKNFGELTPVQHIRITHLASIEAWARVWHS